MQLQQIVVHQLQPNVSRATTRKGLGEKERGDRTQLSPGISYLFCIWTCIYYIVTVRVLPLVS